MMVVGPLQCSVLALHVNQRVSDNPAKYVGQITHGKTTTMDITMTDG
jgi:hypothetical protein